MTFTETSLRIVATDIGKSVEKQRRYAAQRSTEHVGRDMRKRFPLMRPFIAWDGEGYSPNPFKHCYMLFGASTGDSIQSEELSTVACFELMLAVEKACPDAYHVWFSGNYDVNMILKDLPIELVDQLHVTGKCRWGEYRLRYMKGKSFSVSKGNVTCRIDDVFSFFHTSFVAAIREYLGDDAPGLAEVEAGKASRSVFTYEDIGMVRSYMSMELRLLVRLMNRLRDYLAQCEVVTHRWHGPGAVASTILKQRKFAGVHINESALPAQFAYSGGRFEHFRLGRANQRVYVYDIRSAYPYALSCVPDMQGEWRALTAADVQREGIHPYGLYYVSKKASRGKDVELPQPLFWRATNGAVYYPNKTTGWYWGVEITGSPTTHLSKSPREFTVARGIVPVNVNTRPFAWLADYYQLRAQWKEEGRPAQLALKLAMNSIYGKLAQQIGWTFDADGNIRIPKYHQLEYAGFATASARGMIYNGMRQSLVNIVACETDSVMSLVPLPRLELGTELGQWELTEFDDVIYLQSGVYWALRDGKWKTRSRGFGRNVLPIQRVEEWCAQHPFMGNHDDKLTVYQNRFHTMGTSRHTPQWRTWSIQERELRPGLAGKRVHDYARCTPCKKRMSYADGLHTMTLPEDLDTSDVSTKFPLRWEGESNAHEFFDNDEEWITEEDL